MLDKGRISSVQLVMLLFTTEAVTASLYVPPRYAQLAGTSSWIAGSIIPAFYGLLVIAVVLALARRFPSQAFTDYLPEILGRVPGKLLAAAYALMFVHIGSVILNEGTSLIRIAIFTQTPGVVLDVVWVLMAVYGAYLGIEVIARENQLVLPLYLFSLVMILALSARNIDFNNLRPVFESGLLPMARAAFIASAWRGEVFLLLMLYPYLNQKHEDVKSLLLLAGFTLVASAAILFVILGVFGDLVMAHLIFPYFTLAQYISLFHFIERLETLVIVIWVGGVATKLAVFFHSAAIAGAGALGLKSYRATLLPIAVIAVILSRVMYDTFFKLLDFLIYTWPPYATIVELVIPALILLIAVIRKKGGGKLVHQ